MISSDFQLEQNDYCNKISQFWFNKINNEVLLTKNNLASEFKTYHDVGVIKFCQYGFYGWLEVYKQPKNQDFKNYNDNGSYAVGAMFHSEINTMPSYAKTAFESKDINLIKKLADQDAKLIQQYVRDLIEEKINE